MSKILERIARENFRSSGSIQCPSRERRSRWIFTAPPRSPFYTSDTVRDTLQRRERALRRQSGKPSFLHDCLHVFFHR
ncbi:MAG: hypothetical protein ACLFU4_04665 [Opitutales bacterium]